METILTHLQQSFTAWQGSSKKRHTNADLRAQAVKCLDHHSYRDVSAALGMSVNTLRSWQKSLHRNQGVIDNPHAFVAMSINTQDMDTASQSPFSLQVSLPSGITIQISASMKSSVALIVALNKESQPCFI
jgi:hypothetical protein